MSPDSIQPEHLCPWRIDKEGGCEMTRFVHWRKMTWVILFWGVAMTAWLIASGAVVPSLLMWSFGTVLLTMLWFLTRPLWRQGRGFRIRRLRSPNSRRSGRFEGLSTGHWPDGPGSAPSSSPPKLTRASTAFQADAADRVALRGLLLKWRRGRGEGRHANRDTAP